MDSLLSFLAILLSWRLLVPIMVSGILSIVVGHHAGPPIGFLILVIGLSFVLMWQGRHLSGIRLVEMAPPPVITKPIAFIGYAFVGAIWGGVATEILGSAARGLLLLAIILAVVVAWVSAVSKRHDLLKKIGLAAFALFSGFGSIYVLSLVGV